MIINVYVISLTSTMGGVKNNVNFSVYIGEREEQSFSLRELSNSIWENLRTH